jgi:FtsP/CotA-like multicopper oxidase with cupredoxin domain
MRFVATDNMESAILPGRADPLYIFGFRQVRTSDLSGSAPAPLVRPDALPGEENGSAPIDDLDILKGRVQMPSPILGVEQGQELYLTVTNIGFVGRPDLDDSHTIHWHGFRNPVALFDGVPEVSIAIPPGRNFPYYFRPTDPGTYMYHCHFEDSEHVQMGMDGVAYVRPAQNFGTISVPIARLGGDPGSPVRGYAYNDGVAPTDPTSTAYDREFALLLNEIDERPHDGLLAVQEFVWSDYKPSYWVMNGRAYPHTVLANNDPLLPEQPVSSLIQVNGGSGSFPGDRVLLRFASLGYEQHTLQLTGIPMRVVGEDATFLRGPTGEDLSYWTSNIYIGPGEARDALFTAPQFDPSQTLGPDAAGAYNRYYLKNRSYNKLTNGGAPGLGGMMTEVRVYAPGTLPAQAYSNQTYL